RVLCVSVYSHRVCMVSVYWQRVCMVRCFADTSNWPLGDMRAGAAAVNYSLKLWSPLPPHSLPLSLCFTFSFFVSQTNHLTNTSTHTLPTLYIFYYSSPPLLLVFACCAVLCCAVLCGAVLCCAVLCCAVCAVLCCAVLCCVVLCCARSEEHTSEL